MCLKNWSPHCDNVENSLKMFEIPKEVWKNEKGTFEEKNADLFPLKKLKMLQRFSIFSVELIKGLNLNIFLHILIKLNPNIKEVKNWKLLNELTSATHFSITF